MITRRVAAALAVLWFPTSTFAATIRAPEQGQTLQAAIDAAQPGDILEVAAGHYREQLRITKPLTLRPAEGAAVTIEGSSLAAIEVAGTNGVHVEGLTIVGAALAISDATAELRGNVLRNPGLIVRARASVISTEDRFQADRTARTGDPAAALIVVEGRSRLIMRQSEIAGGPAGGILVREHSSLQLHGSSVSGHAAEGITVEGESAAEISDSIISQAHGRGVFADSGSRLSFDRSRIEKTGAAGGRGRGLELRGRARAIVNQAAIEDNSELGVSVADGSYLKLRGSTVARNNRCGLEVSGTGRALVSGVGIEQHEEWGLGAVMGGEMTVYDTQVTRTTGFGMVALGAGSNIRGSGNRLSGNGADLNGASPRLLRRAEPSILLRLDGALAASLSGTLLDEKRQKADTIVQANQPQTVKPGTYYLELGGIRGVQGSIPWGKVIVEDEETPVLIDSGIRLAAGSRRVLRWQITRADDPKAIVKCGTTVRTVPLPPGRYRVAAGVDSWRVAEITPAEGVEVAAGAVVDVPVPGSAAMPVAALRIEVDRPVAAPGETLTLRVTLPQVEGTARLSVMAPDGSWRFGPDWISDNQARAIKDIAGTRQLPLPTDAAVGRYFLLLELLAPEEEGGAPVAMTATSVLVSGGPLIELVAPRYAGAESLIRLGLDVAGESGVVGDLEVSLTAGAQQGWLAPGGADATSIVQGSGVVLSRGTALAPGHLDLYQGMLPKALAGQGVVTIQARVKNPMSGKVLAQSEATLLSCSGQAAVSGRLFREGEPLIVAEGEQADIKLVPLPAGPTVAGSADANGAFDLPAPAGLYMLEAWWRDAEGKFARAPGQVIEVGCEGKRDLVLTMPEAQALGTEQEQQSWRWPEMMPSAWATCGAPGSAANHQSCPCGKLPVCVFSGFERALGSAMHADEANLGDEALSRWRGFGLTRTRRASSGLAAEGMLADGLENAMPCIDAIPVDLTFAVNLAPLLEKLEQLSERYMRIQRRHCGDPELESRGSYRCDLLRYLDEAERKEMQQLKEEFKTVFEHLLAATMETTMANAACPVSIMLGGDYPWGGKPTITAQMTGELGGGGGEVSSSSSATVTPEGGWDAKMAQDLTPGLTQIQESWFCSCQILARSCITTKFDLAGSEGRCDYTLECCHKAVDRWSEEFEGMLAGYSEKTREACCGDGPQTFGVSGVLPDNMGRCPGGSTLLVQDLDCDGLPNSDDPTPIPSKDAEGKEIPGIDIPKGLFD